MRLTNLMTFIVAVLLLAMIPAYLQFARLSGLNFSASFATVGALAVMALVVIRRT